MTVDHGMNVAEIEQIGNKLQTHFAARVQEMAAEIESVVGGTSGSWVGPDAERFRGWWPEKRSFMQRVADDLHGFGQAALNNVSEQRQASGESAGSPIGRVMPNPGVVDPGFRIERPGGGVWPERHWTEARDAYDAWAHGRFAEGGVSHYQCTGWANFRWRELGYDGPDIGGHGGAMASNAGPTTPDPSLHAMASYRSGEYGHVMIVEEVTDGGNTIRVSEMNVGDQNYEVGRPEEYRDTKTYTRGADGKFRASNGAEFEFAAFPGG